MKGLEESLSAIQKAVESIKDEETKKKALEEFERIPKDPSSYRIISPAVSGIDFPATTDKEIVYEEYARKVGISLLQYWSNTPGIFVEIKGNDKTQRLAATDIKKGEYTTSANGTTAHDAFEITVYNNNGDVLEHLNIEKPNMMLDYDCTVERFEQPQLYDKEVVITPNDIRYLDNYHIAGTLGSENLVILNVDHRIANNHAVMHFEGNKKNYTTVHTPGTRSEQEIYQFRFQTIGKTDHLMVSTTTSKHYLDGNLEDRFVQTGQTAIYENNSLTHQSKSETKKVKKDGKVFIRDTKIKTNEDKKTFTKVTETSLGDIASNVVKEVGTIKKGQPLDLSMTGEVVEATNDLDVLLNSEKKKTM